MYAHGGLSTSVNGATIFDYAGDIHTETGATTAFSFLHLAVKHKIYGWK